MYKYIVDTIYMDAITCSNKPIVYVYVYYNIYITIHIYVHQKACWKDLFSTSTSTVCSICRKMYRAECLMSLCFLSVTKHARSLPSHLMPSTTWKR